MTQDEIIRMAREAGFRIDSSLEVPIALIPADWTFMRFNNALIDYAALVEQRVREECAKLCEEGYKQGLGAKFQGDVFAEAIRSLK